MTVITLSAGKKHTIKVGDKVLEVTLRPGEVRYLPFLRAVMDIPEVERPTLPVTPLTTRKTYESWSGDRPKPTFNDIIDMVAGLRGKKDLGFTPTIDNLVSLLRKFKK